MKLYFKSDSVTAKITVDKNANLKQIDALMARDNLTRCTRQEWLAQKSNSAPRSPDPLGIIIAHKVSESAK